MKICSRCKTTEGPFPNKPYSVSKLGKEYWYCRPCNASKTNAYYHRNPNAQKEANARWLKTPAGREFSRKKAREHYYKFTSTPEGREEHNRRARERYWNQKRKVTV